jgi:two-component system, OmpR family, KDP operon response regulator KdpE
MDILVVNNEESMRRILRETLEKAGHSVTVIRNGRAVFSRLYCIDAIITDGTNSTAGVEFVRWVRLYSTVPIIVVSGWAAEFERMCPGLAGYFDCAFDAEKLIASIKSLPPSDKAPLARCVLRAKD